MSDVPPDAKAIFLEAIEKESSEVLAAYLDVACQEDNNLRIRVEKLLQAHGSAGKFLGGSPTITDTLELPVTESIGTRIGPYTLIQEIGQGGMGVVYMAEQKSPVRRRVAVKIVKPGMDSRQVMARFDAERQALAIMDHPSIARIIDAGTTELGRPYFVMELVHGIPINEFCDQKNLTVQERLELFLKVCEAVQHAHLKGIIHRDLKPTNVLVTLLDVVAVPKVIDFGIAKAFGPQLTDHTQVTGFAQFVGTPLYMSPEQAEMNPLGVDTRSDVYSLGVMLYELLTGTTPFDKEMLKTSNVDELRRMLREVDPPRPSARISTLDAGVMSTISERRSTDPRRMTSTLRGELDWIVMRALEKDRNRRYDSASGFAADIRRYLNNEAVQASPPSTTYRLAKFLRRHKGGVAVSVSMVAIFIISLAGGIAMYVRHVNNQHQIAQRVSQSLGEARTAVEADDLVLAASRIAEARVRLGDPQLAVALVAEVDQLGEEVAARRADVERFSKFIQLARDAQDKMSYSADPDGGRQAREALALFNVVNDLGWLERLSASYLSLDQQRAVQETAYETLITLADFGVRWKNPKQDEAARRQICHETLQLLDRARSIREPTRAYWFVRRQAHKLLDDSELASQDDERFQTAVAQNAWDHYLPGHTAGWDGNLDQAIFAYQAALRIQPDHYSSLFFLGMRLGTEKLNRRAEAIICFTGCIALRRHHIWAYINRAEQLEKQAKLDEAEADLTAAITAADNALDKNTAYEYLRKLHERMGKPDQARRDLDGMHETLNLAKQDLGPGHREVLVAMHNVAKAYYEIGKLDLAVPLFEETLQLERANLGLTDEGTFTTMECLSCAYVDTQRLDLAVPLFRETLTFRKSSLGLTHPNTLLTMTRLGRTLLQLEKYDAAEPILRECLSCSEKAASDSWLTFYRMSLFGDVLRGQARSSKGPGQATANEKLSESEALLLAGYAGMKARETQISAVNRIRLAEARQSLVDLYTEWGKPEEAATWREPHASELEN